MNKLKEYLAFAKEHPALFVNPIENGLTILLDEYKIHQVEAEIGRRLVVRGLPSDWAEVGIVYMDQYVRILRDVVRFPDGSLDIRKRIIGEEDGIPGTVILPLYQGRILLVRHFRHNSRAWHLEFPGGFGIQGLSSEECARKELAEEIGATISNLIPLGQIYPNLFSSSDCVALFYAEVKSYGDVEEYEGISEILQVTVPEFERLIQENEINDTAAITAYTRARLLNLL